MISTWSSGYIGEWSLFIENRCRYPYVHRGASPHTRMNCEPRADQMGPLAHAGEPLGPVVGGIGPVLDIETDSVVLHQESQPLFLEIESNRNPVGCGMSFDIRERLLGDAKQCKLDGRCQSPLLSGDPERRLELLAGAGLG